MKALRVIAFLLFASLLFISQDSFGQCGPFQVYESFGTNANPTQGGGAWSSNSIVYNTASVARSGNLCLTYNGVGDWISTPLISNPGILSFWYKRSSNNTAWILNVETSTDNVNWVNRGFVNNATATYQQYTLNLSAFSNIYVRLIDGRASGAHERYVDDLSWTSTIASNNTVLIQGTACSPSINCGTTYTLYDCGGVNDYYNNSMVSAPMTISSSSANGIVSVNFNSIATESGIDYIKLYNGNSTASPALHTGSGFSGTTSPGSFTSTNSSGALTLDFSSDGSINYSGFIATVTCNISTPCTGTPAPGNTIATPGSVVSGGTTVLSLQNATSGTGVSYQWESSTNNTSWTPISGANSSTYTATVTANTYYHCIVTCGGASGTSNSVLVSLQYCTPSGSTSYYISNFTTTNGVTNINNTTGTSVGGYTNYSSTLSCSQYPGSAVNYSITTGSTSTYYYYIWIDWNNDLDFADANETVLATTSFTSPPYTGAITIPVGTTAGNYRMRVSISWSGTNTACGSNTNAEYEDYTFTVLALSPCTGTPAPGNTIATPGSVVSGGTTVLSMQNATSGSGVSYQWESSTNNTSWTTISGASSSTYTATVTANTYYHCIVTCGGSSGTSNSVLVSLKYCTPSSATSSSTYISNVVTTGGVSNINNNSAAYASGGYANYSSTNSVTQIAGNSIAFSVTIVGGTAGIAIWIDWNNNFIFETGELAYTSNAYQPTGTTNGSFTVPAGTAVGSYRMRVVTDYNSINPAACGFNFGTGEIEDYTLNVTAATACSGTPSIATATISSTTGVPSSTFTLSATGLPTSSGIQYQWQSSTDNVTWSDIAGVTTVPATITAPNIITTTYYRLKVICNNSSLFSYSNVVTYQTNYCTPTYTNACSSNDYINSFVFNTINNQNSGCNGNPNNYILYPTTSFTTTLVQGNTYNATVSIGRGATGNVSIWIDFNNDGVFQNTTAERFVNTTLIPASGTVTIPIAIPNNSSITSPVLRRLRVRERYATTQAALDPCNNYGFGETEDYWVTITPAVACSGVPVPGNTLANLTSVCAGSSINLSLQNQLTATGLSFQWESSANNGTYASVTGGSGATTANYTTVVNAATWFRCKVTCSGNVGYSAPIQILTSPCSIMPVNSKSTVITCVGNFYDSGGPLGTYGANESDTLTIVPSTAGALIQLQFNSFDLESGFDVMKIFNGNSVASPLMGSYSATSPGTITSSAADGSLTIVFTSDGSVNNTGWDASISCYIPPPCTGVPSPGNTVASNSFVCTGSGSNLSVTNPPAGTGVSYQWQTANDVSGVPGTFTNITVGTSPTYTYNATVATTVWFRCVVTCSGNAVNSNPVQIISSVCESVNISNGSYTTCAARFYDNGGPGGSNVNTDAAGNYTNNQSLTYTVYPSTAGAKLRVIFNSFSVETCCDNLKIYDGNSTAALLLGTYTSSPGTITSTASDGSLTFVFTSDGSVNKSGWDATFSCFIPPPCAGVPNGGVAATAPSTGPVGTLLTLNVTNLSVVTGLTYQWQSSVDGITWTDIPSAATIPFTVNAQGVAGVISTLYYRLKVTCTNSNQIAYSTVTSFITANYCIPSSTTTSSGFINKVSFMGTLNDVNNTSTYSSTGYQDFTGLADRARQAQGEGINLYVQSDISVYMNGWADWNNDGVFASTEKIFTTGTVLTSTSTFGFVIPVSTPPGNYRVRIRTNTVSSTHDACILLSDGETEDYLITVMATCATNIINVTPGSVCGNGPVTLSATGSTGTVKYYWYAVASGGVPIDSTTVGTWTSPSVYRSTSFYVTASNGTCESIVRTEIKANISSIPVLSFTPVNPIVCGDGAVLRLNATGDLEEGILINERFDLPNSLGVFSVVNIINNNATINGQTQWQPKVSTFIPTYTSVWHPAISSGVGPNNFAFATSDMYNPASTSINPGYEVNTCLVSPVVNTMGFLDLSLDFSVYYSHYLPDGVLYNDSLIIEATTNGGVSWTRVNHYIDDQGIGTRFSQNTLNLPAYINYPSVQIRFRYHAYWSDGLAIDNIKLHGSKPLTTSFSWSPINQNNLFIDSAGLNPYTGGSVPLIYIRPTLVQLDSASSLTFTATATLSNGCSASAPVTVSITPSQWTGDISNDWNNSNNWCSHVVPLPTTKVEIPGTATRFPVISAPATAKSIKLNAGSSLTLTNTGKFSVYGTLTNLGGTFDAKNGTIELAAAVPQSLDSNLFVGNNVRNLIISNDSVKLRGPLNLLNKLSYTGNNRNFITNGNLTLKSSDTLTAFVADLTNNNTVSGNKISGQVTVERFFSARRAWRFLSSPTQHDAQTIKQAWQEGAATPNANPSPRFGIQMTSNRPTWLADGFDTLSPNGPSVKIYNSLTNGYDGITTTNSPFAIGKAYMTFVRGDRSITQFGQLSNTTIAREKGTLVTGNYSIGNLGTVDSQFVSVGNPYACAIDFTKLARTNLRNAYYLYDPALSTLGAFFTCQVLGNSIVVAPIPPSYSSGNFNIQSGQGFIMMTQGGPGAIVFAENAKSEGSILVSRNAPDYPSLRSTLYRMNNGWAELCDGTLHLFDEAFSNQVDDNDARKVSNFNENLATANNGNLLSVETRKMPVATDTLFFKMSQLRYANYHFVFSAEHFSGVTHQPYLDDQYLQSRTLLSMSDSTSYDFVVNSNPGSYASNRFRIVFEPLQPVPVVMDAVAAKRNSDESVAVSWNVSMEADVDHYEVERSLDGVSFTSILQRQPAQNNGMPAAYQVIDAQAPNSVCYYRIKSIGRLNQFVYSYIVKVSAIHQISSVKIMPNPVVNHQLRLAFENMATGKYAGNIYNALGQFIQHFELNHEGQNQTYELNLSKLCTAGNYELRLIFEDKQVKLIRFSKK